MSYEIVETKPPFEDTYCDGTPYVETVQIRRMALQAGVWTELAQECDKVAIRYVVVSYNITGCDPDDALRAPMADIAVKGAQLHPSAAGDPILGWYRSAPDASDWHSDCYFSMYDEYRTFIKVPVAASVTFSHVFRRVKDT